MAQLRSAKDDGHLFILAGQSQGTWQVGERGMLWLQQNCYPIPGRDEYVDLDAGTFSYLKDKGYIYIHGNLYDHSRQDSLAGSQQEQVPIAVGLPLLLRLKEHKEPAWELALDLAELNEEVWEELQRHHADFVTASNASTPISQKQLMYAHCLLRVYPFLQPYQIFREHSGHIKHVLKQAPETPGLISGWQGNIFIERVRQVGFWQRRTPGSTVTFSGELLWLAKPDCEPEWPGHAKKVGAAYVSWQLWRLTVDENAPTSWELVQKWFSYRAITLAAQRQRLEIISPPAAVTEDGHYVIQPDKQVWIACNPPSQLIPGLAKQNVLSAELIDGTPHDRGTPSRSMSLPFPADRVYYFRWSATHPGDYRIRIQGNTAVESLLIHVASLPLAQPQWLRGLICTVASAKNQHTFLAFNDTPDSGPGEELHQLNQFTLQELPTLTWTFEPEQLPIRVIWSYVSSDGRRRSESIHAIQSGEDLTRCWQERVCSTLATGLQASVTLDAGSFGCIELSITIPQPKPAETAWWTDEWLAVQFNWLSRIIAEKHSQKRIPVPASLRDTIRQLREEASSIFSLRIALQQLSAADSIPAWVLSRLQALTAEVENRKGMDSPKRMQG